MKRNDGGIKNLIIFIDPIKGIKIEKRIEISVPKRIQYIGSPVAIREPIALEYIASYLEQFGYKTVVLLKALMKDEEIVSKIKVLKTNLLAVCFGLHSTYLVSKTLELARKIKSGIPEVPIIVGGYHPSGDPTIVSKTVIDYAIIGEGENTCKELLDAIKKRKNSKFISNIKGISFMDEKGKIVVTPPRKRLEFSTLPWPKRYNEILSLCQPGPLSYPSIGKVAQIAFSRGCPYSCRFCASPKMWGGKIKYRKPEDVVNEMKYLTTHLGVNNFFFCDLSFNANKIMIITLCELIEKMKKEVKFNFGCHVMCNTTRIDKEILLKMKEANFRKIDYGIEDVLPYTLQRIKSFQNIKQIQETLELTNNCGILIRGLMMVGYPWETETTMQKRKEIILNLPIDQLRLCFYVPFPGTKIYNQLKDRIIVKHEGFTTDIPAIRCNGIKSKDLKNGAYITLTNFYNSKNYINHVQIKLDQFPELADSYWYFFEYLKSKEILQDNVYSKLTRIIKFIKIS